MKTRKSVPVELTSQAEATDDMRGTAQSKQMVIKTSHPWCDLIGLRVLRNDHLIRVVLCNIDVQRSGLENISCVHRQVNSQILAFQCGPNDDRQLEMSRVLSMMCSVCHSVSLAGICFSFIQVVFLLWIFVRSYAWWLSKMTAITFITASDSTIKSHLIFFFPHKSETLS